MRNLIAPAKQKISTGIFLSLRHLRSLFSCFFFGNLLHWARKIKSKSIFAKVHETRNFLCHLLAFGIKKLNQHYNTASEYFALELSKLESNCFIQGNKSHISSRNIPENEDACEKEEILKQILLVKNLGRK